MDIALSIVYAATAALVIATVGLIIPYFARRGGPAAGRWSARYTATDGTCVSEGILLRSLFSFFWGASISYYSEKSGIEREGKYRLIGISRGAVLVGCSVPFDRSNHDVGVFMIRLDLKGKTGRGTLTSFEPDGDGGWNDLKSREYEWMRDH